ncbi:MAG: histidine ammonia-lyase [Candidatus Thioglobus sp.]|nr:histidine ammonia-lyase [Candidatus Thioglobus sp.]
MITLDNIYQDLERTIDSLYHDKSALEKSRAIVDRVLDDGNSYYGINTGFGFLANKKIDPEQLEKLQHNLLLSHAVGLGDSIPKNITRLMLQLKIVALSLGYSGVSVEVVERLMLFLKNDWIPVVPSKGSLGASGDLAPLAHLALPLLGKGYFWSSEDNEPLRAKTVLKAANIEPINLKAKDGLALINGTQMMTAYGAHILERANSLLKNADILAAISLEALMGSARPFDERIQAIRPHPGQKAVASNIRLLLTDSAILESHKNCDKVQDPYSLRCIPQVHGATRDLLEYASGVIERELNSVTDNPLVFSDGDIISGGNFHGQPLALAMDSAAIAIAEIASIAERRIYLLLRGLDGLPTVLVNDSGINSGFMIPQYTAASLVSHNKVLCHPASVDSIPSCLGQEDHVSMGSISAIKLLEVLNNVEQVLAIEAFTAAQALDFRKPLKAGRGVEAAHQEIRKRVSHKDADEFFGDDIDACIDMLRGNHILKEVEKQIGKLQ